MKEYLIILLILILLTAWNANIKLILALNIKIVIFFIENNRTKYFGTREIALRQYYIFCTMFAKGYYFFKEDRKNCITGLDLTEHYSNDYGVSYYPCDTHFPYCRKCSSQNACYQCKDNYIFVRGKRELYFINDPNRLYNDK